MTWFEIASSILQLGLAVLLVFIGKWLYFTKNAIKSQKEIIDSFQSQSEYIKNLQDVVSRIYDLDDIEKIIEVKEQKLKQSYQEDYASYQKELKQLREEKANLRESLQEFESKNETSEEKISLFGHNILVTFLFYYISLQKLIIHARMGLVIYTDLYDQNFSQRGPSPYEIDNELKELEGEIEIEMKPLSLDEMKGTDLGVHNDLYPNLATWDFEKLRQRSINIRESYSKYLDEYFEED